MRKIKTLKDFTNLKGKRVLVRCDFNVPLSEKGEILDDFRISQTLPTIQYLLKKKAKIILMTHLGRPKGKVKKSLKVDCLQERLMEYLDLSITKAPDCVGEEIERWTKEMMEGEILLLENLRFHKEEEENNSEFARKLAELGDIFVNDAFGVAHRNHASVVGVVKYLPSAIGLLFEKEIKTLEKIIKNPKRPLIGIIGGKKVETKIKVIDKISQKGDFVLVGGLIKKEIKEKNIKLKYPRKVVFPVDSKKEKDIGEETLKIFKEKILSAKTILWNGPLGEIEKEEFCEGTKKIVEYIIESKAFSVAGGGDTVEFIRRVKLDKKFSHLSTGGGAMLTFLGEGKLPALEALKKCPKSKT